MTRQGWTRRLTEREEREEGWALSPKHSHIRGGAEPAEEQVQPRGWRETRAYIVMATRRRLSEEAARGQWSPVLNAAERPSMENTEKRSWLGIRGGGYWWPGEEQFQWNRGLGNPAGVGWEKGVRWASGGSKSGWL